MIKIKNKNIQKKYILSLAALALLATLVLLIFFFSNKESDNITNQSPPGQQADAIDLSPPTEEDIKRAEANKEKNVARDDAEKNQPVPEPGTKKVVKPTITYAGLYGDTVEVGGFVGGVFEDGGKCKATFSLGSTSFSKTVTAEKNINSVDCPVMSAQKSEFSQNGKWLVIVSYDSSNANGQSDSREIEIK